MEYKKQELKAWGLSWQFETVENFVITKPAWKQSYWENFFLTSSPSLVKVNEARTNILEILDVNWTEVVISNDTPSDINVSVWGAIVYTWVMGESQRALALKGWYDLDSTWTVTSVGAEDPTKDWNDVFAFWYIKLALSMTVTVGQYITFTSNTTNLQGISTKVHYVQGWFAYIRGTNLYWTLPTAWETISVHNKIGRTIVLAERDKLVSVDIQWNAITLFECDSDDSIVDIEHFNGTIFLLTKNYVFFWRSLVNCNINIYPLDFFDNMWGWDRILTFGKHLILFWIENQIISPVNGTSGSLWYISNWLNFNHKLYSKYAALSDQGSLYILQDDKEFVKVDIVSVANGEYDLKTTDAMNDARGMLDEIDWDVFITKGDKYISIINALSSWQTISYNYNLSYQHWVTWKHDYTIRSFGDNIFWEAQFAHSDEVVNQELSFQLWGDSLTYMKTCYLVKMVLVAEELRVPDYTLTIDKYIGGMKYTKDVELKNYPIDNEIRNNKNWITGYEQFWSTPLSAAVNTDDLGYIISVSVEINETADMFIFTLKNKDNKITYGGSVIGYSNWLPEVTAYNYKTK